MGVTKSYKCRLALIDEVEEEDEFGGVKKAKTGNLNAEYSDYSNSTVKVAMEQPHRDQ